MFDILCDVWKRPGATHSPIAPVDVTDLDLEKAEELVSHLHKCGIDALLLNAKGGFARGDVLDTIFSAASRRFMLIYVHESLVQAAMQSGDAQLVSYNPMLKGHTLRLAPTSEREVKADEELVATYYLREKDGVLLEASLEEEASFLPYDVILTSGEGIDLLGFATGEVIASNIISFVQPLREKYAGTLAGVVTSRLTECSSEGLHWSYDMTEEFFSHGGTPMMLVSLLMNADKRTTKEAHRVYVKTLAARLDKCLLKPVLDSCLASSLALAGEVPADYIASCARDFTLPIFDKSAFEEAEDTDTIGIYVKCIADVARGAGGTGVACKCKSVTHDALYREALEYFASSASHIILPQDFSALVNTDKSKLTSKETRDYFTRLARLSTMFTSSSGDSGTAVLCDDGFVPVTSVAKLDALGYPYSFVSLADAMERGRCELGEFLLDKFTYHTMLIEPRVRLNPAQVQHIAPFAAYGGQMYRGSAFAGFAAKHLEAPRIDKEMLKLVKTYSTVKCGVRFTLIVNITDAPLTFDVSRFADKPCVMSDVDGAAYIPASSPDGASLVRLMPHAALTVASCDENAGSRLPDASTIREIFALKNGENKLYFRASADTRAIVEIDGIDKGSVRLTVNERELGVITAPPYTLDATSLICDGENFITLVSKGNVSGAVLRMF